MTPPHPPGGDRWVDEQEEEENDPHCIVGRKVELLHTLTCEAIADYIADEQRRVAVCQAVERIARVHALLGRLLAWIDWEQGERHNVQRRTG
jgi:hypothetical protein